MSRGRLRIGIVCGPIHPDYGGPASVVHAHYRALKDYADVTLFGVVTEDQRGEVETLYPGAQLANRAWPKLWFRGRSLHALIKERASEIDVFHAHMLWDHPVYATWRICNSLKKPFIVTPHGSLSESWRYYSLHKRLYKLLICNKIMQSAFIVQALNKQEAAAIQLACSNVRTLVIPNGVDTNEYNFTGKCIPEGLQVEEGFDKRLFLYMGRQWRDKGLDILPKAWKKVLEYRKDAILYIVGPDYKNFSMELQREIAELNISDSLKILPSVQGRDKLALLKAASVFVLPSKSEGFSMALLEAAASGVTCVYSPQCNFPELAAAGGGFEVQRSVESLAAALQKLVEMDAHELNSVGLNAKRFVNEHYTMSIVRDKLLDCYSAAISHSCEK